MTFMFSSWKGMGEKLERAKKLLRMRNFTDEKLNEMDTSEILHEVYCPSKPKNVKPFNAGFPYGFERKIGPFTLGTLGDHPDEPMSLCYGDTAIFLDNSEVREVLRCLKHDDEVFVNDNDAKLAEEKEQK